MTQAVLLDTGVIVALLDRSEQAHEHCIRTLSEVTATLVTCEAVIAESCYPVRGMRGASDAVLENVERGIFVVPFGLDASAKPIRRLLREYADVPIGLADACLVHLATELETGRILTLDSGFLVYRWGRNRPFENLVQEGAS